MSFDTVNERISALNIGRFGLMSGLFIPLQASGAITTDDAENALGWYIGTDVEVSEEWTAPTIPYAYRNRVVWNRLGKSRDRVYRLVFSDAVKWVITNAFIQAEAVNSKLGHDPDGIVFTRLGKSRDRIYRTVMTDAVKWVITRAFVEAE